MSPTAPPQISTMQNDLRAPRGRFPKPALLLGSIDTKSAGAYIPKDVSLSPRTTRRISGPEPVLVPPRNGSIQQAMIAPSVTRLDHARDDSQERPIVSPETRRHSVTSPSPSATFASLSTYSFQPVPRASSATIPHTPQTKLSRSPSQPNIVQATSPTLPPEVLPDLLPLLDGEHHTDELATRFETGWPLLEEWLVAIGGGKGDGDFGRVSIIYR
jgi:nitrogen permease regulator 2-like protein